MTNSRLVIGNRSDLAWVLSITAEVWLLMGGLIALNIHLQTVRPFPPADWRSAPVVTATWSNMPYTCTKPLTTTSASRKLTMIHEALARARIVRHPPTDWMAAGGMSDATLAFGNGDRRSLMFVEQVHQSLRRGSPVL